MFTNCFLTLFRWIQYFQNISHVTTEQDRHGRQQGMQALTPELRSQVALCLHAKGERWDLG